MTQETRDDLPEGTVWLDPSSTENLKIKKNGKWEEISHEELQWPEDN